MLAILIPVCGWIIQLAFAQNSSCPATTQYLREAPYDNYFYSDCNVDAQVVVTSPLPDSNLTIIGPRLVVAFPAGNSGIYAFFQPLNGPNGSLAIQLVNSTVGSPLSTVSFTNNISSYPSVGVQGVIAFNSSARLTIPILGSVRTIRDFTEGPSLLSAVIQNANNFTSVVRNLTRAPAGANGAGAVIDRLWLDNVTVSTFTIIPWQNNQTTIQIDNRTLVFPAGYYWFSASLSYPQLIQLPPASVLNNASQGLITQQAEGIRSLSFLSYTEKLLAGAWRFLTYFGRDDMIAALLLEPVLSTGNGSATEAVIGSVLERINRTDGSVCHEETIGDYATFLNLQKNITDTAAGFTYPMIDTDYYLPILMQGYFQAFPTRVQPLLSRMAGSIDVTNQNLTYRDLALRNAEKIMNITAAFERNQTIQNLIPLKADEIVGEWRDSTYGIGGGRIPFDVNTGLVPAALRAIAQLSRFGTVYLSNISSTNYSSWSTIAETRAAIWENSTLQFFENNITLTQANDRLTNFVQTATFYNGPTQNSSFSNTTVSSGTNANENITTYTIALNGYNNLSSVNVLHTDIAYRLFFLNTSTPTPAQLAQEIRFLNSSANSILRPFPAGLLTPVGVVVANPALSGSSILIQNFTNSAYHGTVIWSWQLAFLAKGFERQIARYNTLPPTPQSSNSSSSNISIIPSWCNTTVLPTLKRAYNTLWDVIDANTQQLESEVWSWTYSNSSGYRLTALGSLPPPPGVSSGTESNIRQLWSLTFLAVRRHLGIK